MALATLSIDLEARLAKLQEGMDKAERIAAKTAAGIEARWGKLSSLASGLGVGIVSGFSTAAITAFTRATVDSLDALNDVSDATGATVENLSALEDVARRNGGTLDDVAGILVKFNAGLKEADGKNGVSLALKTIGLNTAELKKLDPAEALRQVAVALSIYADDGNKARIVQDLFGKSIREAGPYLKDLAEQGRLNATVTSEQAREAERLNKALFAFQTNIANIVRGVAGDLIPALNDMLVLFRELNNGPGILAATAEFFKGNEFKSAQEGLDFYSKKLNDVDATLGRIRRGEESGNGLYGSNRVENLEEDRKKLDAFVTAYRNAANATGAGAGRGSVNPGGQAAPALPDLGGGGGTSPKLGAIRDALAQYKADFLRTEKAVYTESERAAIESFGAILDAKEQYKADFLKSEKDAYETVATYSEKTVDTITDFAKRGQERLQDALGDTLFQALSGNFDDIGKAFGNLIKRMIAESLAADIMGALFGGAKGGSSGSNILGTVLAFFGGGRAGGGPTSPGKMYEVNEQGTPELLEYGGREFLLSGKRSGYVRPLTAGGAGGAGTVISNDTYNIGQGVSAGQVAASIRAANAELEARMRRMMRAGVFT